MAQTPHVGITLLEQSQAQKEITVNEAFNRIDALLNSGVADRDLSAPPSSPTAGDVYIVAASPTGAWAGKAAQVAYFDQVWRFIAPREGLKLWVNDENVHIVYNGTTWQTLNYLADMRAVTYDPANIAQQVVGLSATQTLTNKTLTSPVLNTPTLNNATISTVTLTGATLTSPTLNTPTLNNATISTATLTSATLTSPTINTPTVSSPTFTGNPTGMIAQIALGRLTLTTGVPVTTADVTAATTVYFTPYKGNRIALYSGSAWQLLSFSEISIAVPATTATIYDVWAYNNSGMVTLEVTAWTNDTTRATALAWQDGVYVKSGAATRRYLGSFRTTGVSGQTEDSAAKRYVFNYANRVRRSMSVLEATTSWVYSSSSSWRQANASTANQLDFLLGVAEDSVSASLNVAVSNSTATTRLAYASIGLDTTTGNTGRVVEVTITAASTRFDQSLQWEGLPAAGRHYLAWLESGAGADVQTWYGGNWRGITGIVFA